MKYWFGARSGIGRKQIVRTKNIIKVVRERIRRDFHRSMRNMTRELKISEPRVHQIIKSDLKLKSLKLKKRQEK